MFSARVLKSKIKKLRQSLDTQRNYAQYQDNPVGYINDVLKQKLWHKQIEICEKLLVYPHKVLVKSSHKTGKTHIAACLTSWFYDCFDPSLCITTAPSKEAVEDQLWRQIRILRDSNNLGGFPGPSSPELWSSHDHWAKGLTAAKSESMHGKHQDRMFFIIDEAVGVVPWVFDVIKSQFKPSGRHFWLIIGNPTKTESPMYIEEFARDLDGNPAWHVVQMSSLDHPNIAAGLAGEEEPFPAAVSLDQFNTWIADWCEEITPDIANATDLEFPPGSGKWYRPFADMESRALGRWPSSAISGVWSDAAWQAAMRPSEPPLYVKPEIGCDIALEGDDYTAFHVRAGGVSLYHYRVNGWRGPQIVGKCKELCREYADWYNARRESGTPELKPEEIRVKLDDTGTGGGIAAFHDGFNFIGVNAASVANRQDRYPNKRSELWFNTAEMARNGEISFANIKDQKIISKIRGQAMAPVWKLDAAGRRVLEKKAETKKRLKISPDDMDAVNLAYYSTSGYTPAHGIETVEESKSIIQERQHSHRDRRSRGSSETLMRRR